MGWFPSVNDISELGVGAHGGAPLRFRWKTVRKMDVSGRDDPTLTLSLVGGGHLLRRRRLAKLLAIHGAVTRPGRLYAALQLALESAVESGQGVGHPVETDLLHLGDYRISFADGRPPEDFGDDTGAVVQRVTAADMFLIGTPIFRATYTGALKNLLDLLPVEALRGKVCGLVGMGATDHHYLAVDTQLRPVLTWFGAHTVPTSVYLQSRHFTDGRLSDPTAIESLQALTAAVVAMQEKLSHSPKASGPPPLAGG